MLNREVTSEKETKRIAEIFEMMLFEVISEEDKRIEIFECETYFDYEMEEEKSQEVRWKMHYLFDVMDVFLMKYPVDGITSEEFEYNLNHTSRKDFDKYFLPILVRWFEPIADEKVVWEATRHWVSDD